MKNLGKFVNKEINEYKKAKSLPTDFERQAAYAKVWEKIKKRIDIPDGHSLIINSDGHDWVIWDTGVKKKKSI